MEYEDGFLYAFTGHLSEHEIRNVIEKAVLPIYKKPIRLEINVVKNKFDICQGHSFLWTPDLELFYLLTNRNMDGTERKKYIDDPDWEPVEIDKDEQDWNILSKNEPAKIMVEEPPLFEYESFEDYTIKIIAAFTNNTSFVENSLFCSNMPKWISNESLKKRFQQYERDKRFHYFKGKKYTYPIIERDRNFCKIVFSPLYNKTASFVYNMTRRAKITENGKEYFYNFGLYKNK